MGIQRRPDKPGVSKDSYVDASWGYRSSAPEKQLRPTQIPGQLYRPQRQARYEKLLHEGFLGFEARPLSEIKFKVPYMKELRKARLIEYRQARQAKVKKADYVARILARYEDNLWVRETKYNQINC